MGAEQFTCKARGKTAKEAFRAAVEEARYENGHGGYTGTIAEKSDFKMVTPNQGESPRECIDRCMDDPNHFSDDKWGPAACVELSTEPDKDGNRCYCFFGWASS